MRNKGKRIGATMRVGIVGYGIVGKALARLFCRSSAISVSVYDKFLNDYSKASDLSQVHESDIIFVAVPTPYDAVSGRCDVSAVEEAIQDIKAPICIKSTVPPGTTNRLIQQTGKRIVYSPEYVGESITHPWREVDDCGFVVFGGCENACEAARRAYEYTVRPAFRYFLTTARTAELGKYMENAFLASKVAFVNQFYDLAQVADVEFEALREMFLLDSRVGSSHTEISEQRGFGGKCLPKDVKSVVGWAHEHGDDAPLLKAILAYNEAIRKKATNH